ncbi:hypothetical protein ACFO3D_18045 [Virgibacillus kekensis]|uniref:Uncharacterized protein n=1 Tax=Virgibacillus kekensis TaxID=202261 RepID=A0ABV9DNX7_9BACI
MTFNKLIGLPEVDENKKLIEELLSVASSFGMNAFSLSIPI